MTAAKTIDLRGLTSEERERLLFGSLDKVRTGQSLQMSLEYNPLLLVYSLKAGGEFHADYLKEGPEEWVLELTRIAQPAEKREQLKELLRQARQGPLSEQGKELARDLLGVLDVATLGLLERDLAREGMSQAEIRNHLRGLHLEVLGDSLASRHLEVSGAHPVLTLMEEHQAILAALDSLDELVRRLKVAPSLEAVRGQLDRLRQVVGLLEEAESHHLREEEVIFPRLEHLGILEPSALMREDHLRFRRRKQRLAALAERGVESSEMEFGMWRCEVVDHGEYLVRELASHILKEDNILYRAALQAFSGEDWEQVRRESDAIGYCHLNPEARPEPPTVELDMRSVPLLQRQAQIMAAWKGLPARLRLTNDREPRPLFYLFQATQRGRFGWSYEKAGPEEWIALILKP
jgi:uncharacterized protein (DUF2249 family)/hemerythrin-like domain-containing protein